MAYFPVASVAPVALVIFLIVVKYVAAPTTTRTRVRVLSNSYIVAHTVTPLAMLRIKVATALATPLSGV